MAESLMRSGKVTVDGTVVTQMGARISLDSAVTVNGVLLHPPAKPLLFLHHKAPGVITTHDKKEKKSMAGLFQLMAETGFPNLITVGRLDQSSEGLILLTNDGYLKRKAEMSDLLRVYSVRAHGRMSNLALSRLRNGIAPYGKFNVELERTHGAVSWLRIGLREGRNREIRKALQSVGLHVSRLVRTSFGPFELAPLKRGEIKQVSVSKLLHVLDD